MGIMLSLVHNSASFEVLTCATNCMCLYSLMLRKSIPCDPGVLREVNGKDSGKESLDCE